MKLQSKTLVALAIAGLVAGNTMIPLAFAGDDTSADHAEKEGCKGKEHADKDKDSCKGKEHADKTHHEEGDKDSCKGKDGCKAIAEDGAGEEEVESGARVLIQVGNLAEQDFVGLEDSGFLTGAGSDILGNIEKHGEREDQSPDCAEDSNNTNVHTCLGAHTEPVRRVTQNKSD